MSEWIEIFTKLRRRLPKRRREAQKQMSDYHRKTPIQALRALEVVRGPRIIAGRPVMYEAGLFQRWLRPIWAASDYSCGRQPVECR
jgi:hypothetical protein